MPGELRHHADVAEVADALASGASGGNPVEVQILSSALFLFCCDLVAIVGTGGWPRSAGGIVELIDTENWSSMQGDIYEGLLARIGKIGTLIRTNLH